jgi:hypothetical protein
MSHGSAAASARRHKERHPELYCSDPRCLWATARSGPCPRHPEPLAPSPDRATTPPEPDPVGPEESLRGGTFSQLGGFACDPDPSCGARDGLVVHAIDCDMDEDCVCDIFQGVATGFGRLPAGEGRRFTMRHWKTEINFEAWDIADARRLVQRILKLIDGENRLIFSTGVVETRDYHDGGDDAKDPRGEQQLEEEER